MFDPHPACAEVFINNRATADVTIHPKRKKVAIVGFASNTLHLVPWFDPEFEIWGMNQGHLNHPRRADRWFEMHLPEATPDARDPDYLTWINQLTIPVYMIQCYDDYPTSVRYPIEDAIHLAGRDYFTSSVAFMLALAALDGMTEVHLYGINLAIGDEYFYEKPCAEWWIGKLEGMGIKVVVPHASALLKQYRRYGYAIDARPAASLKQLLTARITEYRSRREKLAAELNAVVGAQMEDEALIQLAEGIDHGADIVLIPQTQRPDLMAAVQPTT